MAKQKSDIRIGRIALMVFGSVFVLAIIVGGLRLWFFQVKNQMIYDVVLSVPSTDIKARVAAQDSVLNSYGWADTTQTTVRIPVDQAMQKLIQESGGG